MLLRRVPAGPPQEAQGAQAPERILRVDQGETSIRYDPNFFPFPNSGS